MRYGYATGFSTPIKDRIDDALIHHIKQAGYDFVEFPLMLLALQPLAECRRVAQLLSSLNLGADSCCNMFPAHLRITGPARDWDAATSYMAGAFERMAGLGVKKVVFGSSGARNLPQGTSAEEGYEQVSTFVGERVLPHLLAHDMVLAMEPIGAYEANFINTLSDGMRVVNAVGHPRVRLLADSVHMQYAHEDPQCLRDFADYLAHIHLCEPDRALPLGTLSPAHRAILETIAAIGYQGTISFEPMPYGLEDMRLALQTVKAVLEA